MGYRRPSYLLVGEETLLSQEDTTQNASLAMAMYVLATVPLIDKVKTNGLRQEWYGDDAAGGGKLASLRQWWNNLGSLGPNFGYLPNGCKSWLIVKPERFEKAKKGISCHKCGNHSIRENYLGAPLENHKFCHDFLQAKIKEWTIQIDKLPSFAQSQPHAVHSAFTHGIVGRWTFTARTNDHLSEVTKPLENVIKSKLIPALTGRSAPSNIERNIFLLFLLNLEVWESSILLLYVKSFQLTNDNSSFVKTRSSTRHRFQKCFKRTKSSVIS